MSDYLIQAVGVRKEFPVAGRKLGEKKKVLHAVNDVSLGVKKGGIFGVVGESGCGKSTLGRCMLRLEELTAGSILFKGKDISKLSGKELLPLRSSMQMIFQNPYASFDPKQRLGAGLKEAARINGISPEESDARIRSLLEEINLPEDILSRLPKELSGGQLQRLAIARALLMDPDFIVADEPVSALDVSVQAQILNLLMSLRKTHDLTMLFISHDMNVVRHLCDNVAVMYLGMVVEQAPAEELFADLMHPYTRVLMSSVPSADPEKKKERIILQGDPPGAIDLPRGCPFAGRCPSCMEKCREERPALRDMGKGHFVACHLCADPV